MKCWCGDQARYAQEVDPLVSNDANGISLDNGQPLAARCEQHTTDSAWALHLGTVGGFSPNGTWWEPTWSYTSREG